MLAHANVFREVAINEPLSICGFVTSKIEFIIREIEKAKLEGAAKGFSEPNNPRLQELGVALTLTTCAMKEIVK